MLTGFWWADLSERNNLEDLGIDGKIILKWTCRRWDVGHGLVSHGSGHDGWRALMDVWFP